MKSRIRNAGASALVFAALGAAAMTASAAGMTILRSQESQIQAGMTADQVVHTLGRPAENSNYSTLAGKTMSYSVVNSDFTMFDVNFSADGKVVGMSERAVYGGR
jgi:uncharacterized cupredoxin-like copper-binding protein